MNKSPLVTIAVPTYNRSELLARLLESLQQQLNEIHRSDIELIVSDNASTDNTFSSLQEFQSRNSWCRIIRNETNLGADANILQCFSAASGKFVWIIGDDDIVLPGGLSAILNLLEREEFDIVHLRSTPITAENACLRPVDKLKIKTFDNSYQFTLQTHIFLTFITGNIVNKYYAESLQHEPFENLVGTSLVQLSWTYTLLRSLRKGAIVYNPVIADSSDARGGYSLFTVFGTNLKSITEEWLAVPHLTRIVINATLQRFFPPFILGAKRGDTSFHEEQSERLLASLFSENYRYHLFVVPLFRLPAPAGRLWYLANRVINRIDKATGNRMLR